MKTFLFCTVVLDDPSRADTWISYFRPLMERLQVSHLLLVDDGSSRPERLDCQWLAADQPLPERLQHEVIVAHFPKRLGRESTACFPGWWRSFCFAHRFAERYGFGRILHVESDFFLLSDRMLDFFRDTRHGWVALWSKGWGFPEIALQIIGADQFAALGALCRQGEAAGWRNGALSEHMIPLTHVETGFIGDRYGEAKVRQRWKQLPERPDYVGQVGGDMLKWFLAKAAEGDSDTIDDIRTQLAAAKAKVAAGDLHGAEWVYQDLIRRRPELVEGHDGLAQLCLAVGRPDESVGHFRHALELDPENAQRANNLGLALYRAGDYRASEAACRRAIRLKPDYPEAWNNLGNAQLGREEPALARGAYREALRYRRDYANAWLNLGRVELKLEQPAAARAAARRVLRRQPQSVKALRILADAEQSLRNWLAALDAVERALAAEPEQVDLLAMKGGLLRELFRVEESIAFLDGLVAKYPTHIDLWNERGLSLDYLNRLPPALESFDRAIAAIAAEGRAKDGRQIEVSPEAMAKLHAIRFNRTMNYLKQGDFETGWGEYRHRWNGRGRDFDRLFGVPRWAGEDIAGKHIIVATEQGIGDTVQFARYLPLLAERQKPGRLTLAATTDLAPLFAGFPGIDALLLDHDRLPRADYYSLLMDLPYIYRTGLHSIPAKVPYFQVPDTRRRKWSDPIAAAAGGKLKVGLAWQGNPKLKHDHYRSFPLAALAPLFELPGVAWFRLQKHHGSEQLDGIVWPIIDLTGPEDDRDLMDTAAIIDQLDLVIAPDSMLVHLAGALAKPVWLPLSTRGEWRWLTEREDSPWYPSMRIFRQDSPGDWSGVVAAMGRALAKRLAGGT